MKKVKMPNGKEYTFASPPFSAAVARCLELFANEGERSSRETAEMTVNLRKVMIASLERGGHTPEEAEEAVCSIPFGEEMAEHLPPILEAIGVS